MNRYFLRSPNVAYITATRQIYSDKDDDNKDVNQAIENLSKNDLKEMKI